MRSEFSRVATRLNAEGPACSKEYPPTARREREALSSKLGMAGQCKDGLTKEERQIFSPGQIFCQNGESANGRDGLIHGDSA